MPHTHTAKKRLRQNLKRRARNRAGMKDLKIHVRQVEETAEAGNLEQLREHVKLATKKLDKAATKRLIHPNTAARKKSQLARQLLAKEKGGPPK
jgi:small subunit ribosomal protein S20